eukprot:6001641-Amphidinium_carterae.1
MIFFAGLSKITVLKNGPERGTNPHSLDPYGDDDHRKSDLSSATPHAKVGNFQFETFRNAYHSFPHHDLAKLNMKESFERRANRCLPAVEAQ